MTPPTAAGIIKRRLLAVPRIAYLLVGLVAGLCAGVLVELIASDGGHAVNTGSDAETTAAADATAPTAEFGDPGPALAMVVKNAPQSAVAAHRGVLLAGLCVGIGPWDGAAFAGDTPDQARRSVVEFGAGLTNGGVSVAAGGGDDRIRARR